MAITKDSLGLLFSPVNPENAESADTSGSNLMGIVARGGEPVLATHPGRVQSIVKRGQSFLVVLSATGSKQLTDNSGRTPDDPNVNLAEFPNTTYDGLGSVNVAIGEKVSLGHQLGTVSFFPTTVGGSTGIVYGVNENGSSTEAARLAPQGQLAIRLVQAAQEPPDPEREAEEPRQAVDEAPIGAPGLNQIGAIEELEENPASLDNVKTSNFPYRSRPQVRFVEQKNQVFSHDVMVYISGVDVTPYLVGQLNINIVDKDGWNEAHLTLNNAMNNFVITQDNMGINNDLNGVFRTGEHQGERKYSEEAKRRLIEHKTNLLRNPTMDVATQGLVEVGQTQGVASVDVSGNQLEAVANASGGEAAPPVKGQADGTKRDRASETTVQTNPAGLQDRRWQLGFMSAVFHKHDPIRIFRKNPIRELDEWMPAFTGYLNEISYDTNYINGQSQVKLSCYDIRAFAAKMRVQETSVTGVTNPRSVFLGTEGAGSASIFTDLLNPTIVGNPLQGKSFEDVMEFLITGTNSRSTEVSKSFGESKFRRGIGDFTTGHIINYAPGDSKEGIRPDPLEHWHALCLFGTAGNAGFSRLNEEQTDAGFVVGAVKPVLAAADNEAMDRRYITEAEARFIGERTTHDKEWAPHKQFVHFLLPAGGTGAKNLLEADVANANSNQIDFRSRLDIMQDFAARIDYQFWVSPMGDFIVEFPQYDFHPKDYGEYETVFKVDKHLSSDSIQDEAGDMVTCVIASGRIRPENEAQIPEFIQPKAVVASPMMMMRYGVLEHEITLPFVSSTESLARLANIEFQKKLAESNKMNMDFNYRPWILPNRPVEHMERKRIGLTTAVNNSLQVFKEASTGITTRYVRRQLFQPNGKAAYTFLFSGTSMPITYREIYEDSTIVPTTGNAAGSPTQEVNVAWRSGADSAVKTPENAANVATATGVASPAASPTPSDEQVGIFLGLAQNASGWNPLNRGDDGSFGLFGLPQETREAIGIGDATDADAQIEAADGYWRSLVDKFNGDLDAAMPEFSLGPIKSENKEVVAQWWEDFGNNIKSIGQDYADNVAQSLKKEWDELFPGDEEPTDTSDQASPEYKEAVAEAEAATPAASGKGIQTVQGVATFTTGDASSTASTEDGAAKTQAEENVVNNG